MYAPRSLLSSYTEVYEKVVLPLKGLSADTGGGGIEVTVPHRSAGPTEIRKRESELKHHDPTHSGIGGGNRRTRKV